MAFSGPLSVVPTGQQAPDTRYGPGNQIYELTEPLTYQPQARFPLLARLFGARSQVTVPAGYQTDLASIPAAFQRVDPVDSPAARPGVIHDYLYTSHDLPRAQADRLFRRGLREEGVPLAQRLAMWLAVRMAGKAAYDQRLGWAPGE